MDTVKNTAKSVVSAVYSVLGVPQNYPKQHMLRRVEALDEDQVAIDRVETIASVLKHPTNEVQAIMDSYNENGWHNFTFEEAIRLGVKYGILPMDRVTLHTLVGVLKPHVCVETGTASGMSASVILRHLVQHEDGLLVSIDLYDPCLNENYGGLIPETYRSHLELKLQKDQPILPEILEELGEIDLFYHDSVHTVKHMTWEYELAWPYIKPGGCLASHDVFMTTAFDDFMKSHAGQIAGGGTVGNFGFVIKAG